MLQISVSHNERSFNPSCGVIWRAQNILTQYRFINVLFHITITLSKQGQIGSFQLIQEHQHLPKSQLSSQLKQIKSFSVFADAFLSKGHQAPKTPTLHHNPVMEGNVLFSHFMEMIKLILLDPNENDL